VSSALSFALGLLAPWTALAILIGLANGALFSLLFGRSPARLPRYLLCASLLAVLFQPIGPLLGPGPSALMVGEVSLVLVSAAAWIGLGVAWSLGL
jgi:hypothetical protein